MFTYQIQLGINFTQITLSTCSLNLESMTFASAINPEAYLCHRSVIKQRLGQFPKLFDFDLANVKIKTRLYHVSKNVI